MLVGIKESGRSWQTWLCMKQGSENYFDLRVLWHFSDITIRFDLYQVGNFTRRSRNNVQSVLYHLTAIFSWVSSVSVPFNCLRFCFSLSVISRIRPGRVDSDLYLERTRFKSRPGHRLAWGLSRLSSVLLCKRSLYSLSFPLHRTYLLSLNIPCRLIAPIDTASYNGMLFQGLDQLVCSDSELTSETVNPFNIWVRRRIGPSRGLCLHRSTQG
jgi:hypothetical protein